ncbi:O-antigen ligase family protein [Bacillus cereus]
MNGIYFVLYICLFISIIIKMVEKNFRLSSQIWVVIYSVFLFYLILGVKLMDLASVEQAIKFLVDNNYYITGFLLFLYVYISDMRILPMLKTVFASSVIVNIVSLILFFRNNYFGMVDYNTLVNYAIVGTKFSRLMSIFASPNVAGFYYITVIVFLISNITLLKKLYIKPLIYGHILLLTCSLLLTFSRAAYIVGAIIVLGYLIFFIRKRVTTKLLLMFVVVVIMPLVLPLIYSKFYFFNKDYILNDPRLYKWVVGVEFFKKSPIIGSSLNTNISYGNWGETFSDNQFLKWLIQFGLVGIIPLLILMFNILSLSVKQYFQKNKDYFKVFSFFTIFFIGCSLNNFMEFFPVNIYLIILATITIKHKEKIVNQCDEGLTSK